VFWLHKGHGVALTTLGAGVAFEKVLDATILVLLATPLAFRLEHQPWLGPVRKIVPFALLALPIGVIALRHLRSKIRWLADVRVFDHLPTLFSATAWVLGAWSFDLLTIAAVMCSLSLPVQIEAVLLVLLVVNLAVAFPAAPGNLGTFELGAIFALRTLGVPNEEAAAFALLYHGVQIVPLLLVWGGIAAYNALPSARAAP
jgi:uncharacterized membrane protein YbhN (UPF0104 family)